jgi:hypothetical protein
MALDFFGVTISANIEVFAGSEKDGDLGVSGIPFSGKDGNGLRYDLWLESNTDPRVPNALKTLAYVQDVTVELGMGLNSKVQLVLAPPYEDALVLLNSPLIQWGVGRLNVKFGYSTGTGQRESFSFGGIIQKPDVKIGNDITITLNAMGIGYAMSMIGGSQEQSYATDDTPATVVEKVLSTYNGIDTDRLYEDFDAKKRKELPFFKPIFKDTPLGPDPSVLERGPRNDWWFVYDIVKSYGLELLIVDSDFRVMDSDGWRSRGPTKQFRLRAGIDPNPEKGLPIYPILSLSSPTESVWIASGVGRQVMKDVAESKVKKEVVITPQKLTQEEKDRIAKVEGTYKKPKVLKGKALKRQQRREDLAADHADALEILEAEIGRASKENSTWGTETKNRFNAGPLSSARNSPGNPQTSMRDHAKGMISRRNHLKGIHVDVQTIGLPDMRPGDIIGIDGFAVQGQKEGVFDGPYGIIEVRHQIGLGGFTTTFKAIANWFPRAFQLAVQAAGLSTDLKESKSQQANPDKEISVEPKAETGDEA